jgi:cobalt-zinc-cadmium resistance protein CzcA
VSELDVKAQNQMIGSAWDIPKTEISGMFGQISSSAQDKNISISQKINPFRIGATRKFLKANSDASQLRFAATKQQIAFSVRESWNNLLYYGKLNSILSKQSAVMDKFVRSADIKFRVGETNSLEKNVASAKQLEMTQRIRQNEAQVKIERSRLKMLLHLKDDVTIADTAFVPLPAQAIDTTAIGQNPEFQLAQKQVTIAEANRKVEQSALWPDLTAGYFIQSITGNQDVDGTPRYYDDAMRFQGFTAGISLPLFFGGNAAKTKAAKINIEREQQSANYLQSQLKNRLVEENEQLATYTALIAYYRDTAEPNARKITTNATKAYQNGDISYVEYVQNLETANSILVNYAEAVRQYNQTIINIQYLTNQ